MGGDVTILTKWALLTLLVPILPLFILFVFLGLIKGSLAKLFPEAFADGQVIFYAVAVLAASMAELLEVKDEKWADCHIYLTCAAGFFAIVYAGIAFDQLHPPKLIEARRAATFSACSAAVAATIALWVHIFMPRPPA
jgi:hypothetical protein